MEPTTSHTFTERIIGAARVDPVIYNEVEHDTSATGQAALVVAIVAVCSAIGSLGGGLGIMIGAIFSAIVGWLIWSAVTYLIGDKLLGGTATWGELLRAIGFANAPGFFLILGILPFFGGIVRFVVGIWMLICGIVAIREALDFSTGKAILTAILGWLAMMLLSVALIGGTAGQGIFAR
jgi:hypothetical protein